MTAPGKVALPDGTTGLVRIGDDYVREVTLEAIRVQGGTDAESIFGHLSEDRQAAMLHGTANVLKALTNLGWVLVPPRST